MHFPGLEGYYRSFCRKLFPRWARPSLIFLKLKQRMSGLLPANMPLKLLKPCCAVYLFYLCQMVSRNYLDLFLFGCGVCIFWGFWLLCTLVLISLVDFSWNA